jgi:hypothetical protein
LKFERRFLQNPTCLEIVWTLLKIQNGTKKFQTLILFFRRSQRHFPSISIIYILLFTLFTALKPNYGCQYYFISSSSISKEKSHVPSLMSVTPR